MLSHPENGEQFCSACPGYRQDDPRPNGACPAGGEIPTPARYMPRHQTERADGPRARLAAPGGRGKAFRLRLALSNNLGVPGV